MWSWQESRVFLFTESTCQAAYHIYHCILFTYRYQSITDSHVSGMVGVQHAKLLRRAEVSHERCCLLICIAAFMVNVSLAVRLECSLQ